MKPILIYFLQLASCLILRKYHPTIVGITGSIGKTSAKEAVYAALSAKYSVRASPKNYNNEIGVPLAIVGAVSGARSTLAWIKVFARALRLIAVPARYPAILVLEMGADRPKDIAKLVALAPPKIGVITAVAPAHIEFFGSVKRLAAEKRRLAEAVPKDGVVVLNADDELVREFSEYVRGRVIRYGIGEDAEFRAMEIREYLASRRDDSAELGGISFKLQSDGSAVPVHLKNALGMGHVHAALAGAAVGRALGMQMVEIGSAFLRYAPPPGRMRLLAGVKQTFIIDDTYNSSPRAAILALNTLGALARTPNVTRFAVLADMLELGKFSEEGHREAGQAAAQCADVLVAVGTQAQWIADEAQKAGMPKEKVFHFHTLEDGVEHFLQERIKPGDVILIKGSQGMRMERLVKGLMAEPLRAKEFLCRQEERWLDKK